VWYSTRPTILVRSGAGAQWRVVLHPRKSPLTPRASRAPGWAKSWQCTLPAGGLCWLRPRTSHCSSKTLSPSASSISPSKHGQVMAHPRSSMYSGSLDLHPSPFSSQDQCLRHLGCYLFQALSLRSTLESLLPRIPHW
jgi:hypothetical protein